MLNFIKDLFVKKENSPLIIPPPMTTVIPPAPIKKTENIPFLTPEIVKQALQNNANFSEWYELLQKFLAKYEVNTPLRVAAFISNTAHETGNYTVLEENLNYKRARLLEVFPKYFNEGNVDRYVARKILIASRIYANRMGNGDEASQDGWKFRGRCLIQITGKNNYLEISKELNKTLPETINYFSTKEGCVVGSLIWWSKNGINKIADTGDITKVRKAVNGGTIGLQDTTLRYNKILNLLNG